MSRATPASAALAGMPRTVVSETQLHTERGVLAAALLYPEAAETVAALDPLLFYKGHCRTLHAAIRALLARSAPVAPLTVAGELERMGELAAVAGSLKPDVAPAGGSIALEVFAEEEAVVPSRLPYHIGELVAAARQRRASVLAHGLLTSRDRGNVEAWEAATAEVRALGAPGSGAGPASSGPWRGAMPAPAFLAAEEDAVAILEDRLLSPGCLTELFSPRGLGKTHVAHALAVKHAMAGRRVLYCDRDNPRREVKRRLRAWGAGAAPTLDVLGRDQVPPLTDRVGWATFPCDRYDLVVIDSLDASTEGVGENDSAKPSRAIATLLDIAHGEGGPAILALGNTIKSAEHSRGSGVVEDRGDIVYEVRDATDLQPSGTKAWWLELPAAGAGAWAERAARRKRRETYRLAFVPSKFRIGEEPEPFVLEVDLTGDPWRLRDVTAAVVAAGEATRAMGEQERQQTREAAAASLRLEVASQAAAGTPLLARTDAEPFLMERGLSRKAARDLIADGEGSLWRVVTRPKEPGRPKALLPLATSTDPPNPDGPGQNNGGSESPHGERGPALPILAGRNGSGRPESPVTEAAPDAGIVDPPDFGRARREPPDGASARIVGGVVQGEPEEEVLELAVSPEDRVSRASDPAGAAGGGARS